MKEATATEPHVDLVSRVQRLITERVGAIALAVGKAENFSQLMPGKLLRTRLAARLADVGLGPTGSSLEPLCAATEMAHAATLCHDRVMHARFVRSSQPSPWRAATPSAAVLIGDVLLCEAMNMLLETEGARCASLFAAKLREACQAQVEQELLRPDQLLDEETWLRLTRGKTGPLFAFIGHICGGECDALGSALAEVGYHIGTAHQLAEDLLDIIGNEEVAGRTPRTDPHREKLTFPPGSPQGPGIVRKHIAQLCSSALDCLNPWPQARSGLAQFFARDLGPVLKRCGVLEVSVAGANGHERMRTG